MMGWCPCNKRMQVCIMLHTLKSGKCPCALQYVNDWSDTSQNVCGHRDLVRWSCFVKALITGVCAMQRSKASGYVSLSDFVYETSAETEAMHNPGSLIEDTVIFNTWGQFWLSNIVACSYVRQSTTCPRNNLSPVQARISKCGAKVQKTLREIPIVLGLADPNRQGQSWMKSKCTIYWVCPCRNSPPIQVRISKMAPNTRSLLILGQIYPDIQFQF